MLKDIKLGFKLLRYGYKLKLNVILLVFFAVIGIASDIMSKGTTIIGGIYFMMSGMFTFQLIMSMDVSELNAPGIAEGLRACSMQFTKRALLGRGVSVIRKGTLIINLPGSV